MKITVASGKGGTGKTTIAVNLALSIGENVQFIDCDVEEPNAHIFLKPEIALSENVGVPIPEVDIARCTFCGKCKEVCQFNALLVIKDNVLVFPELCHSCAGCWLICPEQCIAQSEKEIGEIEEGSVNGIEFQHGRLKIGGVLVPPLIRAVKKRINDEKTVIIDAPPGTSCPVIEAVKGSDFIILATEPTPFGLHDLKLAVEMVQILKIPFGVVVNRADIGDDEVDKYCASENIPILMKLNHDRKIAEAYSDGTPFTQLYPEYREIFTQLYHDIRRRVEE